MSKVVVVLAEKPSVAKSIAAACREQADWIVGLNCTRAMSVLYNATLTTGRVAPFAPIGEKTPVASVERKALIKGPTTLRNPSIVSPSNAATPRPFSANGVRSGTASIGGNAGTCSRS